MRDVDRIITIPTKQCTAKMVDARDCCMGINWFKQVPQLQAQMVSTAETDFYVFHSAPTSQQERF